jgi:predicted nucleic acid-binding protein
MTVERYSLDANILVYTLDTRDPRRHAQAIAIAAASVRRDCWLTLQSLGEFYSAATRKLGVPATIAAAQVRRWAAIHRLVGPSWRAVDVAMDAAAAGRFSYYDALMLATAEEAGCRAMLSEDMADGASFGGIAVMNPFGRDGVAASVRGLLGLDASAPPG